jgi:nucleotide-binding universal stress UspA family protein
MYKKVLLAYDGSIEGRRALREGAKLAQLCQAEVFLLAVVETSSGVAALESGVIISMDEQFEIYKTILVEGVERLKTMGFSPTARLGMGAPGPEIVGVAEGDRRQPRGSRPSAAGATCALVVRQRRHLPGQASSLQRFGRPNRD